MALVELAHLTSPAAAALGRAGDAVGLIPVGALEQHGPHLPMIMDSRHAEWLAAALAERVEEPVVVAPVLAPGLSSHHLAFPGTVSLPEEVFGGVLTAYVEAYERIGIRRIAIITGHGGNCVFIGRFAREQSAARAGTEVIAYDSMEGFLRLQFTAAAAAGIDVPPTDVHAGGVETSIALHIFAEGLVQPYADVTGYETPEDGWVERMQGEGVHAVSATGVLGRPAVATAEAGASIFAALVDGLADWLVASFALTPAPRAVR